MNTKHLLLVLSLALHVIAPQLEAESPEWANKKTGLAAGAVAAGFIGTGLLLTPAVRSFLKNPKAYIANLRKRNLSAGAYASALLPIIVAAMSLAGAAGLGVAAYNTEHKPAQETEDKTEQSNRLAASAAEAKRLATIKAAETAAAAAEAKRLATIKAAETAAATAEAKRLAKKEAAANAAKAKEDNKRKEYEEAVTRAGGDTVEALANFIEGDTKKKQTPSKKKKKKKKKK